MSRITNALIALIAVFAILYIGSGFLVPLCLAGLLAMLISPVVKWLEKIRLPRAVAIIIAIILMAVILTAVFALIINQVMIFIKDLPALTVNINRKLDALQSIIADKTHISSEAQIKWINARISESLTSGGAAVQTTLSAASGILTLFALIPIYVFFFLFYREKIVLFIRQVTPSKQHARINIVLEEIRGVAQNYLTGVFIVMCILAILDTTALSIIGVKYAIFLGIIAAILNIIPYIGVLAGNILAATVAFLTLDSLWYPVAVIITFGAIQFIENNLLTPNITGSKVKINPLATIIALILGGMLWGVAGMILFIPFLGILKVICDNVESLQPYGYLLGSEKTPGEMEGSGKSFFTLKRAPRKARDDDKKS